MPRQTLTRPRRGFLFLELPNEIQLEIFRLLRPKSEPQAVAQQTLFSIAAWDCIRHDQKNLSLHGFPTTAEDATSSSSTARSLLFANKELFEAFAPHYYQTAAVRILDPIDLADKLLANATNAFLYNIRYLSCIVKLNYCKPEVASRTLDKLGDVVRAWPELSNLARFELVLPCPVKLHLRRRSDHQYPSFTSPEDFWTEIDKRLEHRLSRFQRRAQRIVFKDFIVARHLMIPEISQARWTHGLVFDHLQDVHHLGVTFTKL